MSSWAASLGHTPHTHTHTRSLHLLPAHTHIITKTQSYNDFSTLYIISKVKNAACCIRVLYILVVCLVWLRWLLVYVFSPSPSPSHFHFHSLRHPFLSSPFHCCPVLCSSLLISPPRSPPQTSKDQYRCTIRFMRLDWKELIELPGRFFSWHCVSLILFRYRRKVVEVVSVRLSPLLSCSLFCLPARFGWFDPNKTLSIDATLTTVFM